jgi:hypothetical protein
VARGTFQVARRVSATLGTIERSLRSVRDMGAIVPPSIVATVHYLCINSNPHNVGHGVTYTGRLPDICELRSPPPDEVTVMPGANNPTAARYTPPGTWTYTCAGGTVTARRTGTGAFTVTFDGASADGGLAHAPAYGSSPGVVCDLTGWGPAVDNSCGRYSRLSRPVMLPTAAQAALQRQPGDRYAAAYLFSLQSPANRERPAPRH